MNPLARKLEQLNRLDRLLVYAALLALWLFSRMPLLRMRITKGKLIIIYPFALVGALLVSYDLITAWALSLALTLSLSQLVPDGQIRRLS